MVNEKPPRISDATIVNPENGHKNGKAISHDEKTVHSEKPANQQVEKAGQLTQEERNQLNPEDNPDARLNNPLAGLGPERLKAMGETFANEHGLQEKSDLFSRAAILSQDPMAFESLDVLSDEEKNALRRETTHRWSQPFTLYWLVTTCSIAAAVQGMDETVINGANTIFPAQFGIPTEAVLPGGAVNTRADHNEWLLGLVNGAPYLCCGVIGCWLTDPLNRRLGRRWTIFITAFISFITCIWSAVTNTWWHLFIARFFLGFGIGIKSATVPIFAAETAPSLIRGALVMQWQTWTAFGIFLGYIMDIAFLNVRDTSNITGLNWRLMLGSAGVPALFIMAQIIFCPESPRWLLTKGRYEEAYKSLVKLRPNEIQAARDLFYMHVLLTEEQEVAKNQGNRFLEIFRNPRNRRAFYASEIVMFMQQFCGVNAIVYYSSTIFLQGGFTQIDAFGASAGFGALNFVFAFPAFFTIDRFGRRNLLLTTFPLMALFLLGTGFSFYAEDRRLRTGLVATFLYLYVCVYSPGEGPVPFTYTAEAYSLSVREYGASCGTATTWLFNFIVALTFPRLLTAFTPQGAFGWYAGWNIVGFFMVLFFLPETKALTLEELDSVFSVPTEKHAKYQWREFVLFLKRNILRKKDARQPPLYELAQGKAKVSNGQGKENQVV